MSIHFSLKSWFQEKRCGNERTYDEKDTALKQVIYMTNKANTINAPDGERRSSSEEGAFNQNRVITAATESLRHPDGVGQSVSDCGDSIEIQISLEGTIIKHASYTVHGCSFTLVSARAAVALIRGKTLSRARIAVTPETIDDALGGLPEHNKHCTELAAEAAQEAIKNAVVSSREPWKKLYRK